MQERNVGGQLSSEEDRGMSGEEEEEDVFASRWGGENGRSGGGWMADIIGVVTSRRMRGGRNIFVIEIEIKIEKASVFYILLRISLVSQIWNLQVELHGRRLLEQLLVDYGRLVSDSQIAFLREVAGLCRNWRCSKTSRLIYIAAGSIFHTGGTRYVVVLFTDCRQLIRAEVQSLSWSGNEGC